MICADCVGRIGTPVDIGRMSRFACVGIGAATTAARAGNGNAISGGGPIGIGGAIGGAIGSGGPGGADGSAPIIAHGFIP